MFFRTQTYGVPKSRLYRHCCPKEITGRGGLTRNAKAKSLTFTTLDRVHVLNSDYFKITKGCLEKDEEKLEVIIMADVQVTDVLKRLVLHSVLLPMLLFRDLNNFTSGGEDPK